MQQYAKLEDGLLIFPPINTETVSNYNLNTELLSADGYKPYYAAEKDPDKKYHITYKETKAKITEQAVEYTEEEYAQEKREQYDLLTLTPSDVERVLYAKFGYDFDDLKALIVEHAPDLDIKGLSIEFRANNFYRGAQDSTGNRIVDMVGNLLGLSEDDLDYLFINKELPVQVEEDIESEE